MPIWARLSARSFFRDPVAFVRANGDSRGVLHVGAGRDRFLLLRDREAIWHVLVDGRESFQLGKWKRKSRRFVGEALLGLDGAEHRRRRQLLRPALDRRRVEALAPSILSRVEAAQSGWGDGARIHAHREMARLSLLIAGDVLLSTNLEPEATELGEALARIMAAIPSGEPAEMATIDEAIGRLVAERRRSDQDEGDLIGALVGSDLPLPTVRGEILAFLLAAIDEPPSALEAAWCLLAGRPEAEERLLEELDARLGASTPTLAERGRLPYLDAVIRETLRLYPPVRLIDRCPVSATRIGGARVRAGSNVIISPLVTHREPSLYESPAQFLPERWLSTPLRDLPRGAYFPFGAGAHACIGQPLALAIMWLTLASVGRRWRLRADRDASQLVPRAPDLRFTLERR
jgi:cytochrome P450